MVPFASAGGAVRQASGSHYYVLRLLVVSPGPAGWGDQVCSKLPGLLQCRPCPSNFFFGGDYCTRLAVPDPGCEAIFFAHPFKLLTDPVAPYVHLAFLESNIIFEKLGSFFGGGGVISFLLRRNWDVEH